MQRRAVRTDGEDNIVDLAIARIERGLPGFRDVFRLETIPRNEARLAALDVRLDLRVFVEDGCFAQEVCDGGSLLCSRKGYEQKYERGNGRY